MSMKFVKRFALAAPLLLSLTGCLGFGGSSSDVAPHLKQLPAAAQAMLAARGMTEDAPIFIRIFKEESELEVWKLKDGRFEHFKTYPICAWSGELGPKVVQGDKQAPEGFYTVSAGAMNPNSQFHLSFNLGYPNAYDKANSRTGSALMVHGDCRSAGCFAMTDALMEEIYILAREAFKGGQTKFHVHAFPFRMTEENMKRHRGSKWYPFWVSLKEGYDAFEQVRKPPIVKVCSRQYLVNVEFLGHTAEPQPHEPCPMYAKLDPEKLPGIDGVPQTMLAGLKKKPDATEAPVALAQVQRPAPSVALASVSPETAPRASRPAAPQVLAAAHDGPLSGGGMSASSVVRAPSSASMVTSFDPQPSAIRPEAQPAAPALSVAGFAAAPAMAVGAPAPAAQPVPVAYSPSPSTETFTPAPTKAVDPTALQKPNRSGKGGKLTADVLRPADGPPEGIALGLAPEPADGSAIR